MTVQGFPLGSNLPVHPACIVIEDSYDLEDDELEHAAREHEDRAEDKLNKAVVNLPKGMQLRIGEAKEFMSLAIISNWYNGI